MGDRMTPISFPQLVEWVMQEVKTQGTVFGVHRPYKAKAEHNRTLFGRNLETPLGPAAGPHTQLAQNIVASYYTGSRFFELKTVQKLDGEDLPVSKPCILADDEGYNVEWSTELYVPEALDEYIKGWFLLSIMAKEFELGSMDGFQFNMSVGYDLDGIKLPKIDNFIETLKEAKDSKIFKECRQYLLDNISMFEKVTKEDIESIPSSVCNSVTLSTLHGCPPQEIERIATYLMEEKGLNTFIKCNPTLLGYEFARKTMDDMGYDYIAFGDFHFKDDLQYEDAIPMLTRLMDLAEGKNLKFGVKITNTFPVDIKANELPGEEMYMSGKSLYPLSISLAAKLSKEFNGKLRISYSGGADYFNIKGIVDAGIWPVTVATTLLKPGGYQRLEQMAVLLEKENDAFNGVNTAAVEALAKAAVTDEHHVKAVKPLPVRKMKESVPLVDCFVAPCKEGCPIHQDITTYMQLTEEGKYLEALEVITEKNPLPFITGTICPHNCMSKCTRNFYDDPIHIRNMKLIAAEGGYDSLMKKLSKSPVSSDKKAAVIGGGPAGLSAAFFLARGGMQVTIFEKKSSLGGVVKNIIPEFRISNQAIEKDVALIQAMGVKVKLNSEITHLEELKEQGYDYIIMAAGASKPGVLRLEAGESVNALTFLERYKEKKGKLNIGKHVVVIGGGNTAMDTARAAKRTEGVEEAYLVYRRTKRYMPADEEELVLAMEDGVNFKELLSPVKLENGKLLCKVMKLGNTDASGRRGVVETDETVEIPADIVIAAVGEQIPTEIYTSNGIEVTDRGRVVADDNTLETSRKGVYVVGDGLYGPATVVEGIRDARKAAEAILNKTVAREYDDLISSEKVYEDRGILETQKTGKGEGSRCLTCSTVCENCVEVCPNRANIAVTVPGMEKNQIVHVDYMCNECGNCKSFCPYDSAPYLDKFTLFANEADMENSKNQGFLVKDKEKLTCSVRYLGNIYTWSESDKDSEVPEGLREIMKAVCKDYGYMLV